MRTLPVAVGLAHAGLLTRCWAAAATASPPAALTSPAATSLRTPALVVDVDVAQRNADRMLATATRLGCTLRPHVKTHKTVELALLQTQGHRGGIVVSTLAEASFFADAGFDDIIYAVPITPDKLPAAAALTRRLKKFVVMIESVAQLDALLAHPADSPWSVVLAVDSGYHRDGVDPASDAAIVLARRCHDSPAVQFEGLYTHGGHAYDARGRAAVSVVAACERDAVVGLARRLQDEAGIACPQVGVGSTPTCSCPPADGLAGVTEMHPGNYVLYDTMQRHIGACGTGDLALHVWTRVVGHAPKRNTMLVDLGWTAQGGGQGADSGYGEFTDWPELRFRRMSQETGEVGCDSPIAFEQFPVGSLLRFAPHHSCAAAHCHPVMHVVRDGRLVAGEAWHIAKGW